MVETASVRVTSDDVFQVRSASARGVLRLKSWQPLKGGNAPHLAGIELPSAVGTVTEGVPRVLCTGPGEWLLVHAQTAVARLCAVLAPELENRSLVLVDLTEGLVALEVSGSKVREVLGKSCGLDLDSRRFRDNQCARTRFAQIAVLIDCVEAGQIYVLYVHRSHASYLKSCLADAAVGL